MHTVIISGGAGSRLWPVSRESNPKPFIKIDGRHSFLQKTYIRGTGIEDIESVTTITNDDLFFRTEDEYLELGTDYQRHYVLEPFGRNTAAAITAAALEIQSIYGADALLLVLPADHLIEQEDAFKKAVSTARLSALQNNIVTFGIRPNYPETGFGYIEVRENINASNNQAVKVSAFVEKPNREKAEKFFSSGKHFWNSGMFCFKAGVLIEELGIHSPCLLATVKDTVSQSIKNDFDRHTVLRLCSKYFSQVPDDSIDYAVMEKSSRVTVVPCDLGWKDIGSWSAMAELTPPNQDGNRIIGTVETIDVKKCYINSPSRLTAAVGVEDIFIIDTPDALLVAHKEKTQEVKKLVSHLKESNSQLHQHHLTVYRPWGTYTVLEGGPHFKIKRIEVKPKASLSLQMHHHRSEHWIVVSGTAEVINGEQDFLLSTNESTYIPAGNKHRLSNPGVIPLVMIEVQSGEYLEEDDIVRFEDTYGRC